MAKNNMSINIHGKEYITVSERLEMAKKDIVEINTEILYQDPVVIKATVTLKDGRKSTGISGANPTKMIEKQSPYEVAETSALGRALGFLGFGLSGGIATADEIKKAGANNEPDPTEQWLEEPASPIVDGCTCGTKGPYHSKNCPKFQTKI